MGGKTLGMMRTAFFQWTRRTGSGLSGDGVSETTDVATIGVSRSAKTAAALPVEVGADQKEPSDAVEHQLERRPAGEERCIVRLMDPHSRRRSGKKNLQTLIDAEDVRQSLQCIGR